MSAPTLEHTPSSEENLDQLSQAELLERRERIDAQLDDLESALNEYLAVLKETNDPQLAIMERLEDAEQSDTTLPEARSAYSYMIERGEGLLSPELLTLFQKMDTLDQTEEKLLDQLDTRFAPGLIRYARDEALEIISNLDYVAVGKLEKGKSPDLPDSDGVPLRELENSLPRPSVVVANLHDIAYDKHAYTSYRYAELLVDEIERYKAILKRWGVGTIQPLPKPVYDHVELERAEELNNRYRNFHNEVSALSGELRPLLPMHEWAVNLPETEIAKYYEQLASIDIEKELERIKITGLELLPFEFTDKELRDYIRKHIPAIALEGLSKVTFRNTAEKEKNKKSHSDLFGGKSVKTGHHSHDLEKNSAEIVIFADQFHDLYDHLSGGSPDNDIAMGWTKEDFLETVAHEFGHALHHTLPVSILHEWDEVAESEKAEVTSYVSEMYEHDHEHRHMEDFADSFSLMVNRPYVLHNKARQRFSKMQELVTKLKSAS